MCGPDRGESDEAEVGGGHHVPVLPGVEQHGAHHDVQGDQGDADGHRDNDPEQSVVALGCIFFNWASRNTFKKLKTIWDKSLVIYSCKLLK